VSTIRQSDFPFQITEQILKSIYLVHPVFTSRAYRDGSFVRSRDRERWCSPCHSLSHFLSLRHDAQCMHVQTMVILLALRNHLYAWRCHRANGNHMKLEHIQLSNIHFHFQNRDPINTTHGVGSLIYGYILSDSYQKLKFLSYEPRVRV